MYSLSNSVFCARWITQVQDFEFPKCFTKKRHLSSILFRNLQGVADFLGTKSKKCTTTSGVQISCDVNKGEGLGLGFKHWKLWDFV